MKLYVGNLPHSLKEGDLEELFSPHGTVVSTKIIMDRDTGRSRGFAFVEMSSSEEGGAAMEALNGQEVEGRALVVNEARSQERRGGGGGGGRPPRRGGGGFRRDRF